MVGKKIIMIIIIITITITHRNFIQSWKITNYITLQ